MNGDAQSCMLYNQLIGLVDFVMMILMMKNNDDEYDDDEDCLLSCMNDE